MYEYLQGEKVVKIRTKSPVTAYKTDSKMVYLIDLEK